jgi:hypothetical protein
MSVDRDGKGRFRKGGESGNPAGRPKGRKQAIETTGDIARLILKVARRKVPQRAPGDGLPQITLLERNVRSLMSGNPANRLASEEAIELARWAAQKNEREQEAQERAEKQRQAREKLHGR